MASSAADLDKVLLQRQGLDQLGRRLQEFAVPGVSVQGSKQHTVSKFPSTSEPRYQKLLTDLEFKALNKPQTRTRILKLLPCAQLAKTRWGLVTLNTRHQSASASVIASRGQNFETVSFLLRPLAAPCPAGRLHSRPRCTGRHPL